MSQVPEAVAAAVGFVYGPLAENPYRVGKPLQRELEGQYSAPRGQYRIRHRVADDSVVVEVLDLSHRRGAHRPG